MTSFVHKRYTKYKGIGGLYHRKSREGQQQTPTPWEDVLRKIPLNLNLETVMIFLESSLIILCFACEIRSMKCGFHIVFYFGAYVGHRLFMSTTIFELRSLCIKKTLHQRGYSIFVADCVESNKLFYSLVKTDATRMMQSKGLVSNSLQLLRSESPGVMSVEGAFKCYTHKFPGSSPIFVLLFQDNCKRNTQNYG